jgi:hypothetical protein
MTCISEELLALTNRVTALESAVIDLQVPTPGPSGPPGPTGAPGLDGVDGMDEPPYLGLLLILSQSPMMRRGPQITAHAQITPNALEFVGGIEEQYLASPPVSVGLVAPSVTNYASVRSYIPVANFESMYPGWAAQAYADGNTQMLAAQVGQGGISMRQLGRNGRTHITTLEYICMRAKRIADSIGARLDIDVIGAQGHGDTDLVTDGGAGGMAQTTVDQRLIQLNKFNINVREAISRGTGTPFVKPIWLEPLLTGQGFSGGAEVYTLVGRRNIANADLRAVTGEVPGLRALPARSQLANQAESDLVHYYGQSYRYYSEMCYLATRKNLGVQYMIAKRVQSPTEIVATFAQPVSLPSAIVEATGQTNCVKGLEVYNDSVTQLAVSAVTITAVNEVTITVPSTATCTNPSLWKIRNGLFQANTGTASVLMPRTHVCGPETVGTAIDGTVFYNPSYPQEI